MSPTILPPTYPSGEEIRPGDHVRYHGELARIEFIAVSGDLEMKWYIEQCGDGCMILAPSLGRVFVTETDQEEDLQFLSRGDPLPKE